MSDCSFFLIPLVSLAVIFCLQFRLDENAVALLERQLAQAKAKAKKVPVDSREKAALPASWEDEELPAADQEAHGIGQVQFKKPKTVNFQDTNPWAVLEDDSEDD